MGGGGTCGGGKARNQLIDNQIEVSNMKITKEKVNTDDGTTAMKRNTKRDQMFLEHAGLIYTCTEDEISIEIKGI